jgi:hypothetical protein
MYTVLLYPNGDCDEYEDETNLCIDICGVCFLPIATALARRVPAWPCDMLWSPHTHSDALTVVASDQSRALFSPTTSTSAQSLKRRRSAFPATGNYSTVRIPPGESYMRVASSCRIVPSMLTFRNRSSQINITSSNDACGPHLWH